MSVTGTATLIIDFGNSETRTTTILGRKSNGKLRQISSAFSNRFRDLPDNYRLSQQYIDDPKTLVFSWLGTRWATGNIVDREFSTGAIRPTGDRAKATAETTQLAFIRAIYEGYLSIQKMLGGPIDSIDVTWDIHTLLPPIEMRVGAPKLIETLNEISEIDFLQPEFQKAFKINSVQVYPEGFSAYIGAAFDPEGPALRKGVKECVAGSTLVIDVGAGTSDFCVIAENAMIEGTKHTAKVGGNNVRAALRQVLQENDVVVKDDALTYAAETGELKRGSRTQDVTALVNSARANVAATLKQEVLQFIESSSFPLQSIEYVLVVGGGAKGTPDNPALVPLGKYLEEEFESYSDAMEIFPAPQGVDLRELNLVGATVLSL